MITEIINFYNQYQTTEFSLFTLKVSDTLKKTLFLFLVMPEQSQRESINEEQKQKKGSSHFEYREMWNFTELLCK